MVRDSPDEYDPSAFPPFAVTVDIVVFTIHNDSLAILLVKRGEEPFAGAWALPGGFVLEGEDLADAARRELAEETGVHSGPTHLAQLGAYGGPDRDPRMRVVTIAWWAIIPNLADPVAGTDAAEAAIIDVDSVLSGATALAFDHEQIVIDAVEAARSAIEDTTIATSFLDAKFRLSDLRRVYESVWSVDIEPGNFQRKVRSLKGFVEPTGERSLDAMAGRPAELWSSTDEPALLEAPIRRPSTSRPRKSDR